MTGFRLRASRVSMCAWRDSNPHALRHQILSLARLPITPHAHISKVAEIQLVLMFRNFPGFYLGWQI
jgi:hypothetical protein